MGGRGSGRNAGLRASTTEDYLAVDLAWMKRKGCLRTGYAGQITWSRAGAVFASINYRVEQAGLRLIYRTRSHGGEWQDATHPHERNRASYLQENFVPLQDAGVLTLVDEGAEILPGVRFRWSGGHTPNHQVVMIESGGKTAVFTADMYPTTVHVHCPASRVCLAHPTCWA